MTASGQPLEAESGAVLAARAKTLFLRAVETFLPFEAREELFGIPDDDRDRGVNAFARRWRIDCACVREWAEGQLTAKAIIGRGGRISMEYGAEIPDEWWDVLEELNDTKLTPDGGDPRDLGKARDVTRPLAPIAANPLSESRRAFLRRAAWHWNARAELAAQRGYTVVAGTRALEKHAEWLARYRILGVSLAELATEAGLATENGVRSVQREISKVRRAVGLDELPAGRPPKSRH